MRERFADLSVAQPEFRILRTLAEARAAAEAIGMPVAVVAASDLEGTRERRVDYAADLSLALGQVRSDSSDERVVIERWLTGSQYSVVGWDRGGVVLGPIFVWETAPMEHRFAMRILGPVELPDPLRRDLESCCGVVFDAMTPSADASVIDVCVHQGTPHVMTVGRAANRIAHPSDVFGAMGATPETPHGDRKVAVQWLRSRSGIVGDIAGVEEARSMADITSVHVGVTLGDRVGHVIDAASRDRLGHVVATGDTLDEARGRAKAARDGITIRTQTVL